VAAIIALVAGAVGLPNVASGAATASRVLFGIFIAIALVLVVFAMMGVSLLR
jgi:uncharacterized membrane protein YtjA (UPF0391 family)